jgi:hypothetical protein
MTCIAGNERPAVVKCRRRNDEIGIFGRESTLTT